MNLKIFLLFTLMISKYSATQFNVEKIYETKISRNVIGTPSLKGKVLRVEKYNFGDGTKNYVISLDYDVFQNQNNRNAPRLNRQFNPICQQTETALNFNVHDLNAIYKHFLNKTSTFHKIQIHENNLNLNFDILRFESNMNSPFHVVINCKGSTNGLDLFNRGFILDSQEYQDLINEVPYVLYLAGF